MIISNASIFLAAEHHHQESRQVTERLELGRNEPPVLDIRPPAADPVFISPHSFSLSLLDAQVHRQTLNFDTPLDSRSRVNLLILQAVFKQVTGRSLAFQIPADLGVATQPAPVIAFNLPLSPGIDRSVQPMTYLRHESYREEERLRFDAVGVITTADGREISFTTSLTMRRSFYEESSLSVNQGAVNRIDPLVINFDGQGAALSPDRFAFDLDSDGTDDQIAILGSGSGFLALDRDGDGAITHGLELFGPATGRGFEELARYDEDGNNFIDEGDSIYSKLRIWMMHEDGSSQLVGLGEKSVGAIFLGHVTSPFQLKDTANNSLGEVVNSGIYVTGEGRVGTVQEINLTV